MSQSAILLHVMLRIPATGVASFQAYEAAVLPLLTACEGTLQRRLRNAHGTFEVHIVRFATRDGFERFRSDPQRAAAAHLLAASGAVTELTEVNDVH